MRHKEVWKRLGAWTLAFSMVAGSCPSMALAEEADQQIVDVEELSDQEQAEEVSQAEEMPSGENICRGCGGRAGGFVYGCSGR